jgi:hypothetical protein
MELNLVRAIENGGLPVLDTEFTVFATCVPTEDRGNEKQGQGLAAGTIAKMRAS